MALAAVGVREGEAPPPDHGRNVSSIGPGATNMVTAAGVAHANRLPLLLLSGDTFASRLPDPVLQQVEHFGDPSVTRERLVQAGHPLLGSHHHAQSRSSSRCPRRWRTMLDPATCGPAFLGLPQDVQAEAFDYPGALLRAGRSTRSRRPRADSGPARRARSRAARGRAQAADHRRRRRALLVRRGRSSRAFAERHNIPVVETVAGKACLVAAHPLNAGPIGVTGCTSANALAAEADVVVAVGTRLQDFTTGSWTRVRDEGVRFVGINTAGFDAVKHLALPVVGDAREALIELAALLGDWRSRRRLDRAGRRSRPRSTTPTSTRSRRRRRRRADRPTYAQVIGAIDRLAIPTDYALDGGRWVAGRAEQRVAGEGHQHLRRRVRLLVHGLRDLRWLGGQDGACPIARSSCSSATART